MKAREGISLVEVYKRVDICHFDRFTVVSIYTKSFIQLSCK